MSDTLRILAIFLLVLSATLVSTAYNDARNPQARSARRRRRPGKVAR